MAQIKWRRKVQDFEAQQDMKRRAVLDAAARLFSSKGYALTSIDDLASSLNLTKPSLYYYVDNKEDMLVQCTKISLEFVDECYRKAESTGNNGLEKLLIFLRLYAECTVGDYGWALIHEAIHYLDAEKKKKLRSTLRSGQNMLEQILHEGMRDKSLREHDPKYVVRMLFSIINQMHMWFDPNGPLTASEIADRLIEPAVRGLVNQPSDLAASPVKD